MLIPPNQITSAVFLGAARSNEPVRPAATGFILGHEVAGGHVSYVVTCTHVISQVIAYAARLVMRVNEKGGGFRDYELPYERWHDLPGSDLSICLPPRLQEPIDHIGIRSSRVASADWYRDEPLSAGREVFAVGLFAEHPGRDRGKAIVRVGHVAMLPDASELVEAEVKPGRRAPIEAMLVEMHSRGGHSGSPLYLYPSFEAGLAKRDLGPREIKLVGIIQGHKTTFQEERYLGDPVGSDLRDNSGIAIVIPSYKLLELLDLPAVRDERAALLDAWRRRQAADPEASHRNPAR